jgi:hypothetical protein
MPKTATKRDWSNEKELAREIGSGLNDVIGRGTLAGLLGAPGDIAGLAENSLRGLLGKPQVKPWGGSEYIGEKLEKAGLVSSKRRPKTELLASLISPAQIATAGIRAPKYAKAALRAIDNLEAAPTMRNLSQRGAIDVWHGSPHKYDVVDSASNMGKGEGAQAYGYGYYNAGNKAIGEGYRKGLTNKELQNLARDSYSEFESPNDAFNALIHNPSISDNHKELLSALKEDEWLGFDYPHQAINQVLKDPSGYDLSLRTKAALDDTGYLYRNQLRWPDPAREAADPLSDKHFLDWDKPLSEQSPEVQAAMNNYSSLNSPVDNNLTGEQFYKRMMMKNAAYSDVGARGASKDLNWYGIPGIRYLDGGSRSAGAGTHNYVTFDDNLVNILERNGQPVTAPQPGLAGLVAPQDEALRVAQQNAAKPVSEGGLGLRPDNTPEERAVAMGFDIDNPMSHGTDKNIKKFKVGKKGYDEIGSGVYTAPINRNPYGYNYSNAWAQGDGGINYPLVVKNDVADYDSIKGSLGIPNHKDIDGNAISPPNEIESDLIARIVQNDPQWFGSEDLLRDQIRAMGVDNAIKKAGYAGAKSKKSQVPNQVVTFDPRNIRSRFAAFDPMRRDSSDLLAGSAGVGIGALINPPKEKKEKTKTRK